MSSFKITSDEIFRRYSLNMQANEDYTREQFSEAGYIHWESEEAPSVREMQDCNERSMMESWEGQTEEEIIKYWGCYARNKVEITSKRISAGNYEVATTGCGYFDIGTFQEGSHKGWWFYKHFNTGFISEPFWSKKDAMAAIKEECEIGRFWSFHSQSK
jgi:hypothetical protein